MRPKYNLRGYKIMKKSVLIIAALLAAVLVFAGCSKEEDKTKQVENITREDIKSEASKEDKKAVKEDLEENKEENKEISKETEKEEAKNPSEEETKDIKEEEAPKKKEEEAPLEASAPSVNLNSVRSEIKSRVGASDAMDLDINAICSLYGIDASGVKDASGFVVMAGTFPHEVVMVEAKDAASASGIEAMLKVKHDSFVEQSKGYDAENYALAQKCKVERRGNHLAMFLSPDFEAMTSVYSKYIN